LCKPEYSIKQSGPGMFQPERREIGPPLGRKRASVASAALGWAMVAGAAASGAVGLTRDPGRLVPLQDPGNWPSTGL
jgi:hypothetical protein